MLYNTKTEVYYRERKTGHQVCETIFAEQTLRWFYENYFGFQVFKYALNNSAFCWLYGKLQNLPSSSQKIPEFVAKYQINIEDVELPLESYKSFNAFFSRRLKLEARPFAEAKNLFCAPGDGKVLVYPKLFVETRLPVKGSSITLASLLASKIEAKTYIGGSALITRLAPYDYHRFHFPDDGEASSAIKIKGCYHSVNPIALSKIPDLYCRNKRNVTEFYSKNFGRIAYIEVGAITVGTIIQTYTPGSVIRGQEKGYFQYGGSTLVLLFEPGAIVFDEDLIADSAAGIEVHVLAGSSIGKKP